MAQYTIQGEQYIAEKAGNAGSFNITHFVLAKIEGLDHNVQPSANEQMPAPADIVDEREVTQKGYLNANQTVYSLILDSTVGDYEFNWIGLKTDDGRLLAVAYDALQKKLRYDGVKEGNNITRNFVIEFEGAKDAAAINVSAETWQMDFTARLNQIDENQRLACRDLFGKNTFIGNGFYVERAGSEHIIKSGIGYIEGIRLFLANDINLGRVVDKSIWLDAALVNDAGLSIGKVASKVSSRSVVESDYFSTEQHYLFKIADVDYNGLVIDSRNVMKEDVELGGVTKGLKVFAKNEVAALSAIVSEMFAGQVSTFPGTKLPLGWLKANGQTVSRSNYPYLWRYANSSGNIASSEGAKTSGQFGPGNGINTFTLPDLRGQHLRYWDDGRGIDNGRSIASEQKDDIKKHNHNASSGSDGNHAHAASSVSAGNHAHTARSASAGSHVHGYKDWGIASSGGVIHDVNNNHRYKDNLRNTDAAGDHSHAITVNSGGAHSHAITVNSGGAHSHAVSVEDSGIIENRVKNIALMVCIKY